MNQPVEPVEPVEAALKPKNRKPATLALVSVGLTVFLIGSVAIALLTNAIDSRSDIPVAASPSNTEHDSVFDEPAVAGPDYHEPTIEDFELEPRITSQECFGTAGCLVEFEVELTYFEDDGDLDPDTTYEITYEVHGVEDPPYINTLEIEGTTYWSESGRVSTESSDDELTIEVTGVRQR